MSIVLSIQRNSNSARIRIRLRECMDLYEARTGLRVSYSDIAAATGLSLATVQSIGSRGDYNATLSALEALCATLHVTPMEILEWKIRDEGDAESLPYGGI